MDGRFILHLYGKNTVNFVIGGVGMLTSPVALKSRNSIEMVQPRMMVATFNGKPCTTIISYFSSTNATDETDLLTFYNERFPLVRCVTKLNVLIVGGDMNAQIGKDENNKFYSHNLSNRNGDHLTDFSLEKRLTCLNTKFQKILHVLIILKIIIKNTTCLNTKFQKMEGKI